VKIWHWLTHGEGDPLIDSLIVPPVQKYAGTDESLALKAKRRREAAEVIRRRAEAVASGSPVTPVWTMARRQ
jgi:hypothetical protein